MIEIKAITTKEEVLYDYIEQLVIKSFPTNEYRPLNDLREFTDHNDKFCMNVILDENQPIGLISYWSFNDFYYVEHFATDTSSRNKGYGSKTLQKLFELLDKPVVLEIEEPDTEMAMRRKAFYERNGFVTWPNKYFQPPYHKGDDLLPLLICCHGNLESTKDFELVNQTIHKEVYNYED